MKNPRWHRDEIILALDLYFKLKPSQIHTRNPLIIEISNLLNKLPIHENIPDFTNFRNANGVSLKLSNFLSIDPSYYGKGMGSYSKLDKAVFNEFVNNRKELAQIANQIKITASDPYLNSFLYNIENEEDIISVKEGCVIYKLHKYKERNQSIIRKKKNRHLKIHGRLDCEICGFDFYKTYGEIGLGFIECHHIRALSELDGESITELNDLILVCPNCHRMLHINMGIVTIEELKNIIDSKR